MPAPKRCDGTDDELETLMEEVRHVYEALRDKHDRVVNQLRSENHQLRASLLNALASHRNVSEDVCAANDLEASGGTSGTTQVYPSEPGCPAAFPEPSLARFARPASTAQDTCENIARPGLDPLSAESPEMQAFSPRVLAALSPTFQPVRLHVEDVQPLSPRATFGKRDPEEFDFAQQLATVEGAGEIVARTSLESLGWDASGELACAHSSGFQAERFHVEDVQSLPTRSLAVLAPEAAHFAAFVPQGDEGSEECKEDEDALPDVCGGEASRRLCENGRLTMFRQDTKPHLKSTWSLFGGASFSTFHAGTSRRAMTARIKARLQLEEGACIVTGRMLFEAMTGIGVDLYTEEDLKQLLRKLNHAKRRKDDNKPVTRAANRMSRSVEIVVARAPARQSRAAGTTSRKSRRMSPPRLSDLVVTQRMSAHFGFRSSAEKDADMEFDDFMDCLLDVDMKTFLHADHLRALHTVTEVLASGNINVAVAGLASIDINEMVAPLPSLSLPERMEPVVALLILTNGILIGVQSDSEVEDWIGWQCFEYFFVGVFLMELMLRFWHVGARKFFIGKESSWNGFDLTVILVAVIELTLADENWNGHVLRIIRLTRITRFVRLLRFRCFADLTLMLKGLLGGARTLGWAMVLFIITVYIISLFVHSTLGKSEVVAELLPNDVTAYFGTVPRCMFTSFRCFTTDCTDSNGVSLVAILSTALGDEFKVGYVVCVAVVTFGIFNLIIAVYIEAVLNAAKEMESGGDNTEALRMAHTTKKLMKRICTLHRVFKQQALFGGEDVGPPRVAADAGAPFVDDHDDVEDEAFDMTEAEFKAGLQDRVLQGFLDELDVPQAVRDNMFDVIDADGNGTLQINELVRGLYRIRGEPKKSDTIACLLSVRCVQRTMNTYHQEIAKSLRAISSKLPFPAADHEFCRWSTFDAEAEVTQAFGDKVQEIDLKQEGHLENGDSNLDSKLSL